MQHETVEAVEPSGAPEEFGLTLDYAAAEKRRVWNRQETVLAEYRQCGRIGMAARAVGMTRWATNKWTLTDVMGWRDRLKVAHQDWCEDVIETRINDRLADPQGNRGSDILLMFQAKAEMPEKYRETVTIVDTQETKDMLGELRRIGSPRVVEGRSKVVEE